MRERHRNLGRLTVKQSALGLSALLRIGSKVKRKTGSHKILACPGWADVVFAFRDGEEIRPRMLARIAAETGLRPRHLEISHEPGNHLD